MVIRINLLLYACMLIINAGCMSERSKLVNEITEADCYWDIHDMEYNRVVYCYQFKKNGACKYLFYERNGQRSEFDDDDNVVTKTWSLEGDTMLIVRSFARRILSLSNDTLLLENPVNNEKVVLVKRCN